MIRVLLVLMLAVVLALMSCSMKQVCYDLDPLDADAAPRVAK